MMSSRVPNLDLLYAFEAVADCRNFTRAAERLHITQSAVSHQIRRLELETGLTLFIRSPHRVELTGAGLALLAGIRPSLNGLAQAFARVDRSPHEPLGVELESSFGLNWMTPRLARFSQQHPSIPLAIFISNIHVEFAGTTELAIKWGDGHWPGYKARHLMDLNMTPMCAPALAARLVDRDALAECVLLHDRDHESWAAWLELANLTHFPRRDGHVFGDTVQLWRAATLGNGIALCAREFAEEAIQRGELAAPFADIVLRLPGAYYELSRPDRALSAKAVDFSAWLTDEIVNSAD